MVSRRVFTVALACSVPPSFTHRADVTGLRKCAAAPIPGSADYLLVPCTTVERWEAPARLLRREAWVQVLEATPLPPVWLENCQGAVIGIVVSLLAEEAERLRDLLRAQHRGREEACIQLIPLQRGVRRRLLLEDPVVLEPATATVTPGLSYNESRVRQHVADQGLR